MLRLNRIIVFLLANFIVFPAISGKPDGDEKEIRFTDQITLSYTPVKDQHRTGTCWSFATLSLLESEMLRMNKRVAELSPMYIVYHTYIEKADRYVRMHGNTNFDAGGIFHDVTNMIARYGITPDEVYRGLNYGEDEHVHGELDLMLKNQVDAVVKNPNRKLTPVWQEMINATLETYLGTIPQQFDYDGATWSPQSFAREYVGLKMDDYVEITSFAHHPFYARFIIEIPDNWSWDMVYNVPLDELEEIMDYGLQRGYTFAWAADVSEKGFLSGSKGIAVVPDKNISDLSDAEISRWENLNERQREEELHRIQGPVDEKKITQEARQLAFDNFQTTDDHGMHVIGSATDQAGNQYYKVKNSWGDYNHLGGFFYASKAYARYKTTLIMIHKDGIPPHIRKKLNL
jgi:bleomycin hydrolase